jgi:hypothetical protein
MRIGIPLHARCTSRVTPFQLRKLMSGPQHSLPSRPSIPSSSNTTASSSITKKPLIITPINLLLPSRPAFALPPRPSAPPPPNRALPSTESRGRHDRSPGPTRPRYPRSLSPLPLRRGRDVYVPGSSRSPSPGFERRARWEDNDFYRPRSPVEVRKWEGRDVWVASPPPKSKRSRRRSVSRDSEEFGYPDKRDLKAVQRVKQRQSEETWKEHKGTEKSLADRLGPSVGEGKSEVLGDQSS